MMKRTKKTIVTIVTAATMLASVCAFSSCDALSGVLGNIPFISEFFAPAVTLDKIEVTEKPTDTEYVVGEKFDPTGMVVTAIYSDKSEAKVTNYTYTPTGALKKGDKIVISYTEGEGEAAVTKTTNLTGIKIKNDVVDVDVKTPATKTEYMLGEKFDPAGMVLTVTYENGEVADLKIADITVEYPTKALTAADTVIKMTYEGVEFEQAITFAEGVFIEAEDGIIVSSTVDILEDSIVDDVNTATGGKYVGDMKQGDTITFVFNSDKAGKGDIEFRLASQYLKEDSNWTPIWMGDCQFNKIVEFSVNGVPYNIKDSVWLPGGGSEGGEPDQTLWFNWQQVKFTNINFVEGRNDILLKFIPHDYTDTSQSGFSGSFTANIDSLVVTSAECEVSPCELTFDEKAYTLTSVDMVVENEVPYLVLGGTGISYDGYYESEIAGLLSLELVHNGNWTAYANSAVGREITINEDGSFVLKVDISAINYAGNFYMHFGYAESGYADVKVENGVTVATNEDETNKTFNIGYLTYELVPADEVSWGLVAVVVSSNASIDSYVATGAKLEKVTVEEVETVNFVVEGTVTWTGYAAADVAEYLDAALVFDFQGNLNSGSGSRVLNTADAWTVEVTETETGKGTFKMSVNVASLTGKYAAHFGDWVTPVTNDDGTTSDPNGASQNFDYLETSAVDTTTEIVIGYKTYKLFYDPTYSTRNENVAADDGDARRANCYGCVGVIVTNDQELTYEVSKDPATVSIIEKDGKAYLVLAGTYTQKNYTEEEVIAGLQAAIGFDLQTKGGSWPRNLQNAGVVALGENNTYTYTVDLSSLENNLYITHYGAGAADYKLGAAGETALNGKVYTIGNKTYTLTSINTIVDGDTDGGVEGVNENFWGCLGITVADVVAE